MSETSFSPIEIGLLTVADRRGVVRTPRKVDERNDPTSIERLIVLRRLVGRGLLKECQQTEESVEIEFTMTDNGREALAASDRVRPQDG